MHIPVHLQVWKAAVSYHPDDQKGELDSEQQWKKFKGENKNSIEVLGNSQ